MAVSDTPTLFPIHEVIRLAGEMRKKSRFIRKGQSLYNALREIAPAVALRIHGTDLDSFYHDERFHPCVEYLMTLDESGNPLDTSVTTP